MLTAEFRTECADCGEWIEPGEPIRRAELRERAWRHDVCPVDRRRPRPVCPVCFLEQPCAC